jgi:Zn-dependent alcohol dehydrogenase
MAGAAARHPVQGRTSTLSLPVDEIVLAVASSRTRQQCPGTGLFGAKAYHAFPWGNEEDYRESIDLPQRGHVRADDIVTAVVPLKSVADAFAKSSSGQHIEVTRRHRSVAPA